MSRDCIDGTQWEGVLVQWVWSTGLIVHRKVTLYLHQGVSCILAHRYFMYLQSTACYNGDVTLVLQMGILGRREGEMM